MPLSIQARASRASRSSVDSGVPGTGAFRRKPGLAGERWISGFAEEDRAFMAVCEPDADDFDNAMVLGVCHEIDGRMGYLIPTDDLTAHEGLEAVSAGLEVFDIHPLVDARQVSQFGRGERRTTRVLRLMSCPVMRVPGDPRVVFGSGASPRAGQGLLSGSHRTIHVADRDRF